MVEGLEHVIYKEKLRELGLLSPEKALEEIKCCLNYLMRGYREYGAKFFSDTHRQNKRQQMQVAARENLIRYQREKKYLCHEGNKIQREYDISIARDNQHSTRVGLQQSTEDVSRELEKLLPKAPSNLNCSTILHRAQAFWIVSCIFHHLQIHCLYKHFCVCTTPSETAGELVENGLYSFLPS